MPLTSATAVGTRRRPRHPAAGLIGHQCSPILYQERNVHDLLQDFREENLTYTNVETWAQLLTKTAGSSARECYRSAIRLIAKIHPSVYSTLRAHDIFMQASGLGAEVRV